MNDSARRILESRRVLTDECPPPPAVKSAEEGGCGVVGLVSTVRVRGRQIFEPSIQMHNRGNGKGGGIATAAFDPKQLGVDAQTLRENYILQIALLDNTAEDEVECECILPFLRVDHKVRLTPVADYRDMGLDVRPPDIVRYFVRVKEDNLAAFAETRGLGPISRAVEDEFIYQNSYRLNQKFYASLGEQRAFVLSHARDLMIFKIVGYAEQVVQYYGLDDFRARMWIAHQRFPTRGRVWHPGGAHPFIGMNEALVHNGDLANFHGISEYLKQHNVHPMFLTDTEVGALHFDLLNRTYGYPLEYIIEAMAPTTELDFDRLPRDKQIAYRAIQARHMHGSPDGPWFFIIARSDPDNDEIQLLAITDTAMLRPQVFALSGSGTVQIGLVCSEKQAIDATLRSLAAEDERFCPVADRYWNVRGGSHTDGGAFMFTVGKDDKGYRTMECADKFGNIVEPDVGPVRCDIVHQRHVPNMPDAILAMASKHLHDGDVKGVRADVMGLPNWSPGDLGLYCEALLKAADDAPAKLTAVEALTWLHDHHYYTGDKRRSSVLYVLEQTLTQLFDLAPLFGETGAGLWRRINFESRDLLAAPEQNEDILVIDAEGFQPEGDDCDSVLITKAFRLGWKQFVVYRLRGQRFHGVGLGPDTDDVRIDLYGSSGDYVCSGADGLEMHIHGSAQDQLAQIMKRGKLVIYGDVGQTFMYGAKGGEVYVLGNAAGRPLINAVGRPRVVINGTCLDFLAESFMAGDPHDGGGFVVVNGLWVDDHGNVRPQPTPYPGSNLFSLASGGAIFVRDPDRQLIDEQLNGAEFADLTDADWELILPYLQENQTHFGIDIGRDLLTVDGVLKEPAEVYRKVQPLRVAALARETVPE
ncbi:MAG: glutamate synthase [Phycisphaerae bacterium]|jgi:glutamate synthase domain-containing protein 1/glutamate synthase domain-containing protein 3|nr:glutamate synthase [Phycisphaerae bacterium]